MAPVASLPAPVLAIAAVAFSPLVVAVPPPPAVIAPPELVPPPAVTPARPTARVSPALRLDRFSTPPGAPLNANGVGCDPATDVVLEVDGRPLGIVRADDEGAFSVRLALPDLAVGRYEVVARCGPTLTAPFDVIVSTSVQPITTALAVLVFFVLLGLAVIRRQRTAPVR